MFVKIIWRVFAILLVAIVLILIGLFTFKPNPYSISGVMEAEEIATEAIVKADPAICDKIVLSRFAIMGPDEESLKYTCYRLTSIAFKDPSICEKNVYSASKSLCYGNYAATLKDESFCKKDLEHGKFCFSNVAVIKNDIKICENLQNFNDKEYCYLKFAQHAADPSICTNKIKSTDLLNGCYRVVASARKDVAICSKINETSLREECTNTLSR